MTALVSIEPATRAIRRWECGGDRPRLTHEAEWPAEMPVTPGQVEMFRLSPPVEFRVDQAPKPPPPSPFGGTPAALRAA